MKSPNRSKVQSTHRGDYFHLFSHAASRALGTPVAFCGALLVIVVWAIAGPLFQFSDSWQLVINTSTTIVTFLMVFLIQNTQNRDARALHLKLDELLSSVHEARTGLIDVENLSDDELDRLEQEFRAAQRRATRGKPA
jgi:low affinity Fe/Cu permease